MLNNRIYQMIFDEISVYLPAKWNRLVVYLEYGEASYSISFYVKSEGKYIKCFDIPSVDDEQLMNSFGIIDEEVNAERQKEKGELWTNMTMIVDPDGNMHTDFDYTDLSEDAYQYSQEWKKKYLV